MVVCRLFEKEYLLFELYFVIRRLIGVIFEMVIYKKILILRFVKIKWYFKGIIKKFNKIDMIVIDGLMLNKGIFFWDGKIFFLKSSLVLFVIVWSSFRGLVYLGLICCCIDVDIFFFNYIIMSIFIVIFSKRVKMGRIYISL